MRIIAALLITLAMATTAAPAYANSSHDEFQVWYSDPENKAWYDWHQWMQDPENAAWFEAQTEPSIQELIRRQFGNEYEIALRVAKCESNLNPNAVSPTNDHGLMQINKPSWYSRFTEITGKPWSHVYDPETNLRFAFWLAVEMRGQGGGWGHWSCY